jgi:prepilin-type processing-associated H-X9-DG protein
VLSVLDGKQPNAVDHPFRTALTRSRNDFEPVAAAFLDIAALPPMPAEAARLGLDGLKRIELQWGIQDDASVAILNVVAPAPRRGVLALLDQPTFQARSLPPMPAGLTGFSVLSLDFAKTYDQIIGMLKQANPQGADGFDQLEAAFRQRFGFDVRKDLLANLGPKLAIYSQAGVADAAVDPAAAMLAQFAGLTIAAQARDDAFAHVFDPVMRAINLILQMQQAAARRGQPGAEAPAIAFRKQEGPRPTYVLESGLPPQILAMVQPTVRLGKDQLVIAATTTAAERAADLSAAAADRLWKPTGAFLPMARRLPGDLVFLIVSDPRETLPDLIQKLPVVVQQLNLMLPAVRVGRGAARRAQCANNLKQIARGLLTHMIDTGALPEPAIANKDGKPLLSWRVAILPFIDQLPLYNRFKLDEAWDSPNNKALIKEMPVVYRCPERADDELGATTYRVFIGPGTVFEKGQGIKLEAVTDGAWSTLLVVEAKEEVPWTKPDVELLFDPAAVSSLVGAGSSHEGCFNAAFCDGAVRTIPNLINVNTFHDMITRVDPSWITQPPRGRPQGGDGPLRVDADLVPRADELKPLLFPASLAIVVDGDGARIVSRESFPSVSSPAVSGVLVGLLLPAVQAAREAARRAQCVNNLKQMGLAMHNYVSANDHFPGPAITGKDGKPLLSWRVAILPYIEQKLLYDKFKLDEPWDSPHNKALIDEMPRTFACPSRANLKPGETTYRAFVGPGAMFEKGKETALADITDGTMNTIVIVESTDAAPWTKPDADLPFDPAAKPSLFGAGSPHPGGFNALFADGSVRFIKSSISLQVFRALITRAGGEVVNAVGF